VKIERIPVPANLPWLPATPPAHGRVDPRLLAGALAVSAILWTLAWYGDTVGAMVAIWQRSDTFAHGFLIVPISAWLIWRRRDVVANLPLRPSPVVLPLLALAGFVWFFAGLASVGVVQQYAVVAMIVLVVWVVLGTPVAAALAFPLSYLVFAVPAGEFMLGMMMEHTADVTVAALRLTGIPVYREGQFFSIPSGNWSVVEACSGLRYLIASVTVGVLYAYLTYRSLARRAAFIAASFVLPIIANWFRAYMIVMIGHLSSMKYAVGVDHLIYGWVFFGVVMALLFWVGSYWREDLDDTPQPASATAPHRDAPLGALAATAVAAALLVAAGPTTVDRLDNARSAELPVLQAPVTAAGWNPVPGSLTRWNPHFQEARAVVEQEYADGTARAGMHIRYYRKQRPGAQLVTSQNVLVSPRNREWANSGEGRRVLTLGDHAVPVVESRLRSPHGNLLVWRWYWIDGEYVVSPYRAKFLQAKAMLFGRGDDGAAIFLYAPYESGAGAARRTLQNLAGAMLPAITKTLENARETGNAQ
jgi:exosortase A